MPSQEELQTLVIHCVRALAEDFEIDELRAATAESELFGATGPLDSMALVNLIADIEDAVQEQFEIVFALADEKAMSAKNSPFLNVSTLTQAVLERIK